MTAKRVRDGKGGKAARRQSKRLKAETRLKGLVCAWCGEPIDTTLPSTDRMSFTMDHPEAVANGGHVSKQKGVPMHRGCNSSKGDRVVIDVNEWGAS